MSRLRWIFAPVLAGTLVLTAACGGDGDGDDNGNNEPLPTPSGPALSEDEYLRVFCKGITDYQDALMTAPTADKIAEAIQSYIDSMRPLNPPEDLREWHADYVHYLQDGLEDPTSLSSLPPPELDEDTADRLALKTQDIDECKYPTFLERQAGHDETPAASATP